MVALAEIDQEKLQGDDPILVHMDTPVVLSMLDRMMGGEGDPLREDISSSGRCSWEI